MTAARRGPPDDNAPSRSLILLQALHRLLARGKAVLAATSPWRGPRNVNAPSRALILAQALDTAIEAERSAPGGSQAVIARSPRGVRSEMRALMRVVRAVECSTVVAPEEFRVAGRGRLMAAIAGQQTMPILLPQRPARRRAPAALSLAAVWGTRVASAALAVSFPGFATLTVSASSLPGELLYTVKEAREELSVRMATDDEARLVALLLRANARVDETARLALQGRSSDVLQTARRYDEDVVRATNAYAAAAATDAPQGSFPETRQFQTVLEGHEMRLGLMMAGAPEHLREGLAVARDAAERGLEEAGTHQQARARRAQRVERGSAPGESESESKRQPVEAPSANALASPASSSGSPSVAPPSDGSPVAGQPSSVRGSSARSDPQPPAALSPLDRSAPGRGEQSAPGGTQADHPRASGRDESDRADALPPATSNRSNPGQNALASSGQPRDPERNEALSPGGRGRAGSDRPDTLTAAAPSRDGLPSDTRERGDARADDRRALDPGNATNRDRDEASISARAGAAGDDNRADARQVSEREQPNDGDRRGASDNQARNDTPSGREPIAAPTTARPRASGATTTADTRRGTDAEDRQNEARRDADEEQSRPAERRGGDSDEEIDNTRRARADSEDNAQRARPNDDGDNTRRARADDENDNAQRARADDENDNAQRARANTQAQARDTREGNDTRDDDQRGRGADDGSPQAAAQSRDTVNRNELAAQAARAAEQARQRLQEGASNRADRAQAEREPPPTPREPEPQSDRQGRQVEAERQPRAPSLPTSPPPPAQPPRPTPTPEPARRPAEQPANRAADERQRETTNRGSSNDRTPDQPRR